jgi:metal-responsive CopG/Arc/MetJ family transcriptional regulator
MSTELKRTTLSLPTDLLAAADRLVQEGKARSRTELVTEALRAEVRQRQREALDAEFAEMANDGDYLAEVRQLMGEFAQADRESWNLTDPSHRDQDSAPR